MDFEEVKDPQLLSILKDKFNQNDSYNSIHPDFEEVQDPALLKQLNSSFQVKSPIQQSNKIQSSDFSKGSDIIRDMIYGMGKSVGNIGKTLTGGKPDMSGRDYRKQNPSSPFNNPMESQLDKFGNSITPSFEMPDIRSKNSSPTAVGIGQALPFALAGGTSILGSAAAGGAYGATQYEPGQQGTIDKALGKQTTRTTSAIEDALIASVLHMAPEAISNINPFKYTPKNVAKNIINTGEKNKEIYSQKYNELFNDAENQGFDDALNNVDIDMKTIKKYTPSKKIVGVEEFNNNPTLQNAHVAKSDLMKVENKLNSQTSLNKGERNQLKAISDAISSLKSNMFRDAKGNLNEDMLGKYNTIQRGYANDVIPYKNKSINKYKRNEISSKELINSLKRGEFAAKKGANHPELFMPEKIKAALTALGIGTGIIGGGNYLINKISDQK